MKKNHFLVVGAGVSGICIALHLIERGQRVTMIDNNKNVCSTIAAGIVNPIVFRRMTKSWRVDELLPYCRSFYHFMEQKTGENLIEQITIRRMFSSEQERNYWLVKQKEEDFKLYLEPINEADDRFEGAINLFGSGRLKEAFYVLTEAFIRTGKELVASNENGSLIQGNIDYTLINPELASYGTTNYDGIIFCEGFLSRHNPWFKDLPVNATKGDILTIQAESISQKESLNRKCFLLPIGNNLFKVGSTYEWNTTDSTPIEKGKQELIEKLKNLSEQAYQIIQHQSGIRPTTPDRRPIIGSHQIFNKLHVFNGMGSKGYMLAPLLAKEFTGYLLDDMLLNHEVSISRFYTKLSN